MTLWSANHMNAALDQFRGHGQVAGGWGKGEFG
jgi:hypothetical protein